MTDYDTAIQILTQDCAASHLFYVVRSLRNATRQKLPQPTGQRFEELPIGSERSSGEPPSLTHSNRVSMAVVTVVANVVVVAVILE